MAANPLMSKSDIVALYDDQLEFERLSKAATRKVAFVVGQPFRAPTKFLSIGGAVSAVERAANSYSPFITLTA